MSPIVLDVDQLDRRLLDQSGTCIVRSKFKSLALASRGSDVVLYQSGRQPTKAEQETGYFARAIIDDVFDHPLDEAKCIVWLKRLTYFRDTIPLLKDSGQGYEASLFNKHSNLIGWRAAEDLRRLTKMEFEHLAGAAGIAKEGLDESKSTFDTPEGDIVPLPLFAKRFYQVRDASFARRIYTAYRGRCAISGLSLLSPDGRLCSLEAVHWYPHHFEPRTNIASGGLLAPSWHARFDSGAIMIWDDYTWSANVEDRDTLAIAPSDRRLFLPANRDHWPDVHLLRRQRALIGLE